MNATPQTHLSTSHTHERGLLRAGEAQRVAIWDTDARRKENEGKTVKRVR